MKSLRLQLRFLLPLSVLLMIAAYITVPIVDQLTLHWFLKDLDMRANLIADAMSSVVKNTPNAMEYNQLQSEFDSIVLDERLYAVGLCDPNDVMVSKNKTFPTQLSCAKAIDASKHHPAIISLPLGDVHIAAIPLELNGVDGNTLIIVHDLSYVRLRSADTRRYLIILFAVLGAAIALITVFVVHISWRGWVAGTKALLRGEGLLKPFQSPPELQVVASDLRVMLREMDEERRSRMNVEDWTPERLRKLLQSEMRGEQVIVVSNREPYIHIKDDNGIHVQHPASGLVTAIEPVMRACSGTWIAHGGGNADKISVDRNDRIRVPPDDPSYTLRRVWLSEQEEKGYYYGFANEGMWPLCHLAHVRPVFRLSDWECYKAVNQKFADAIVKEATISDPIILVQDYHFALLPEMIRQRLPNATIITFWHIPWPNPESFGVCPWHEEILKGMLGSSILGFHTRLHCRNFMDSVDRFLEARIRLEDSIITFSGALTQVNSYPISIHWPSNEETSKWPSIQDCRKKLRDRIGVGKDHLIAIGIDRFDYTKGIIERFNAVDRMLEKHPDMRNHFTFIQFAAPTRALLDEYQLFAQQVNALAERINKRYGSETWKPIYLVAEHQESDTVTCHYRGSDCCVVTSLHDGMNLVAKEFVSSRDDYLGTLVLSQFTGAARELHTALIVNPYDVESTADALYRGLTMPPEEQNQRMRSMRDIVREDNIYRWAANMLLDANQLRRVERVSAKIVS
jgi:trehalose-6-phosphate synthase